MRRTTFQLLITIALVLCAGLQAQTAAERQHGAQTKSQRLPADTKSERLPKIGGEPPVILTRKATSATEPQFTAVELLPGRGMNVFQVRAFIPGLGEQELIASPSLTVAAKDLAGGPGDYMGAASFKFGGAILLPWANRIRGQLTPDGKWIKTDIAGHELTVPANFSGKKPGAEKHAIHGMMLESKFKESGGPLNSGPSSMATLHAANFSGHWPSQTDVEVWVAVRESSVDLQVTAKNVGKEVLPMGIGWHPYFALPSGKREQVELHIPARQRTVVNNYDDVFPTGQIVPVSGTEYDFFDKPKALANQYLDDCFVDLARRDDGAAVAEIIDPAAKYGLRIVGLSKEITSFQVYAPPDKQFVALEPQFNLADPFNKKVWGDRDTGMVMLKPGESVTYHVRLEVFVPSER